MCCSGECIWSDLSLQKNAVDRAANLKAALSKLAAVVSFS